MGKLSYDFKCLASKVEYSESSPTGLVNKLTKIPVGYFESLSGNPRSVRVKIGGTRYLAHRIIWVLINGSISDDLDIDHIDGNPWNNKITNLRLVDKYINQRNRKKMKNNRTGVCGVAFHRTSNNSGGWNEYIRANWIDKSGKQKVKDFNLKNFASFDMAVEFAELYRNMKIEDKHTYTERHGN